MEKQNVENTFFKKMRHLKQRCSGGGKVELGMESQSTHHNFRKKALNPRYNPQKFWSK